MSDAVIVEAVRSPGGRYKRGGLAGTRGDEIGIQVMKGLLARVPELKPEDVDDVIVGCSFPEGEQGMNYGRIIAMGAGLPSVALRDMIFAHPTMSEGLNDLFARISQL